MCALCWVSSSALAHPPEAKDTAAETRTREAIRVHTMRQGAWQDAVTSIEFELEQAGYAVSRSAETPASTTLTVQYEGDQGWVLHLEDSVRGLRLEARGSRGASAQVVGLHAVEMIHASRLDLPKPARRAPDPAPVVRLEPRQPPPSADPLEPAPPPPDSTNWALEIGVSSSNVGLLGPRLGVVHRWTRAELGFAAGAGFFSNKQQVGAPAGLGTLHRPTDLGPAWTSHRTIAVLRSGLAAAYVFRPGRELRPSLGVSSEVVVPLVDTGFFQQEPFQSLTQLDYGVAWVPALEVGARLALSPKLALRGAIRVGPALPFKDISIVKSSQAITFPRGVATANLSLLFGRSADAKPRTRRSTPTR